MHILIIEDDLDTSSALQAFLELEGHSVEATGDGDAALRAAGRRRPDVALIDIGLPGMDGYEVARRMRASAPPPHPFLVALTGWGQPEHRQRAIDAGFDAHLVKPLDPVDLGRLLEQMAGRAPVTRGTPGPGSPG